MALRETHVEVDFVTDADPLRKVNEQINDTLRQTRLMGKAYDGLTETSRNMLDEMKEGWKQQRDSLIKYRNDMIGAQYNYYKLARNAQFFKDRTEDYMKKIEEAGKVHKKVTDEMIANNWQAKQSILEQIGTMANMTTQAKRNAEAYKQMKNPLYLVNNAGLKLVDTMTQFANRSNVAAIALERLGPTANMKELKDEIKRLNQGLGAMPMVAIGAGLGMYFLYRALAKVAHGPKPSEVYEEQAELLKEYADAVKQRTREIIDTWELFEEAQFEHLNPVKLLSNLKGQVKILGDWSKNISTLAKRGVDEGLIAELRKMGPAAASEVAALTKMTDSGLNEYVALWKEKNQLARTAAVTELQKLKEDTDQKIQELQNSLKPLGLAWEKFKNTMVTAFEPMVQAFSMVAVPILNFLTHIGQMITKFNEAHPTLALMAQAVLMLVPLLTLLLLPLGLGIGLVKGYALAFGYFFRMIAPIITFMATMSATVWIVAAALVGLAFVLSYAWNHFAGFRNAVINTWNAIVAFLMPGIQAVKNFFLQIGMEIKTWWDQNSAVIIAGVMVVVNLVKGWIQQLAPIFMIIFANIVLTIKNAWELIKMVIKMAVDFVLAVIKALAQFLTGDFAGAWQTMKDMSKQHLEAIRTAVVNIFNNVKEFLKGIDLFQIGSDIMQGLLNGIKSMGETILNTAKSIGDGIKKAVSKVLGVASPAKEMIKIGVFTGQGMQLGLQQSFPMVQQAAYEMGSIPMDYTPEGSVSVNNSRSNRSVVFSPTVNVSASSGSNTSVKQQVKEALEDQFNYLRTLYDVEVEY